MGVLITSNILLVRRNRELNAELSSENHTLLPPMGHVVPPLRGLDPAGRALTLAYGSDPRPTLLFVLSPHGEYCSATWPAWERVLVRINRRRFRPAFVNIRPGVTSDYVATHHLGGIPVFKIIDPRDSVANNLVITPEIIEVSPAGVVANVWVGELEPARERKLLEMFAI